MKIQLVEETVFPKPVREEIVDDLRIGTYELTCKPNSATSFTLLQSKKTKRERSVEYLTPEIVQGWILAGTTVQVGIKQKVQAIAAARATVEEIQKRRIATNSKLNDVTIEQTRLTKLIQATQSDAGVLKIYLKKLTDSEKQLVDFREQLLEIDGQLKAAIAELRKLY